MATLLVRSGARVDSKDADGNTALLLAARGGRLRPAHALVALGADLYATNRSPLRSALVALCSDHARKFLVECKTYTRVIERFTPENRAPNSSEIPEQ